MRTDTERLDFIESYLEREGQLMPEGQQVPITVRSWSVVTQRPQDNLRETIDALMAAKEGFLAG